MLSLAGKLSFLLCANMVAVVITATTALFKQCYHVTGITVATNAMP